MSGELAGRIAVFAGPSLPTALRPADDVFAWLPPAMAGDAVKLKTAPPSVAVLIDGLFDVAPAVRHKELLSLMASGVPLIGGASMGALRAAELHSLGMIGVGRIFEAFAGGRLTGDDEVALMHGPEEWDWTPLTEALVNVRATILHAVRARVIDVRTARLTLEIARETFYQTRTWPGIVRTLAARGRRFVKPAKNLAAWLPAGRLDIKRSDALECLEVARTVDPASAPGSTVSPETIFSKALAEHVNQGIKSI